MIKSIIKSVTCSFLVATSVMLFMIPQIAETVQERGFLAGVKLFFVADLFFTVVIFIFFIGVALVVSAIERWCE